MQKLIFDVDAAADARTTSDGNVVPHVVLVPVGNSAAIPGKLTRLTDTEESGSGHSACFVERLTTSSISKGYACEAADQDSDAQSETHTTWIVGRVCKRCVDDN